MDPLGLAVCGLPDDLNLNSEDALRSYIASLTPEKMRQIRDCLRRQRPDVWRKWVKAEKFELARNKNKRLNNKGKGKSKGLIKRCALKYLFLAECEAMCVYSYSLCLDSALVQLEESSEACNGLPFDDRQSCIDNLFYIWSLDTAECGILYTACGLACLTPIPND
jgi:hypothetical protein